MTARARGLASRLALLVALVMTFGLAFAQEPATPAPTVAPAAVPDREIQIAAEAFTRDARTPAWVQPHAIPASKATGAAVIELLDTQMQAGAGPESSVTYTRRAIRVNDTIALTPIGRVSIAFIPAYQRVVLHTLRIQRAGALLDRLANAQPRFLQRETALENNLYSGIVTASILVDDLRVGDVLEIAFSVIGTNPVFGRTYSAVEGWEQPLPIGYRRVILESPASRPIAWKFHGDLAKTFPKPVEVVRGTTRSLTFEESDLAGVPTEPNTPAGFSPLRWLQFSEYADWNGVATWAAGLFDVPAAAGAERKALVETLKAKPTVEERVVAALEFVQSEVRYFSVSLGTSSHRPATPDTVLERRYGDCKDKSLLLVALLGDMGIKAVPLLARAGNRTGFDDWLPTPLAFDHVVVGVDVDGTTWVLDSTRLGQHGRLARMGQPHDGIQVLAAAGSTRGLVRVTVADREALARDERTEELRLDKLDGDGVLTVVQVQHGVNAEALRTAFRALPQGRLESIFTTEMERRYPGAKLDGPVRVDDDPLENRLVVSFRATLPQPAKRGTGGWNVALRAENLARLVALPPEDRRRAPLAVRYPAFATYRFEAIFPDDVSANGAPSQTDVSDAAFTAHTELSFRGNRALVVATFATRADRTPAADVPTLRADLMKVQRGLPASVVIRDTDIKKAGAAGAGDLGANLRRRQEDLVRRIGTSLDAGRLSGSDLARAHCQRGGALAMLDRTDEGLRDGDAAVAVDPDVPDMLACRGVIRSRARDFDGAVDDYTQAIVLGAERGRIYFQRGQARFAQGRWTDAADDFAKGRAIDAEQRTSLYYDVWRVLAFVRAKQPLPADLQARAGEQPDGAWPRPALAMLAGAITPEQMQAAIAARTGDEAAIDATEGSFYLGERLLAAGDTAGARAAFETARAAGLITYIEYVAAGLELDRLDGKAR